MSARRPPDIMVGQLALWWGPEVPADQRASILDEMRAIRPQQRRAPQPRPTAARAAWERRGAAHLDAPDAPVITDANRRYHRHAVRVYYRSMADKVLCFEAHGLTEGESSELYSECRRSDAYDAQLWHEDDDERPPFRHGARLVVLPSQDPTPVLPPAMSMLERELSEMRSMLARAGYDAAHASALQAEGMGPEGLRARLAIPTGVGSLEYTHGFRRAPVDTAPVAESLGMQRAKVLAAALARLGVECEAFLQHGRPSVGCHRVAPTTAGTWRQIVSFTADGDLLGRVDAGRRTYPWLHDWPGNPWRHGPAHDAVEAVLLWHPSDASPDSFTYARCGALATALSRLDHPSGRDHELHAACNSVLYGSDAERALARTLLAENALRVIQVEGPARAHAGREVA